MTLPQMGITLPADPSYTCEVPGCGKVTTAADTHSLKWSYAKPGHALLAAFECGGVQHFACCAEHAVIASMLCLVSHILPAHEQMITERGLAVTPVNRERLAKHLANWIAEMEQAAIEEQ